MWFDILPSIAIIATCGALPHIAAYLLNKLVVGNYYRRKLTTFDLRMQYLRDIRLTKHAYVIAGI